MLTGQAKTDYQKEYMRRYRAKKGDGALSSQNEASQDARGLAVVDEPAPVRPKLPVRPLVDSIRPEQGVTVRPKLTRPEGISENQWAYIQMKAEADNE